jgi:RNA polymerase sigma factor (sigma-70 family)
MPRLATRCARDIETLLRNGALGGNVDGDLLDVFVNGPREAAEAAFTGLVERHGSMVLGVCERVLGDRHDAEDASQATFLLLATRARSIRRQRAIGSWLFGVALRVALRVRSNATRRRAHERRAAKEGASLPGEVEAEPWLELYEELDRMPARLRKPLVACYLEDLTAEEAAAQLGWSVRTLHRRLANGRDRMRVRLGRRGIAPPAVGSGMRVAAGWKESTVQTAIKVMTGAVVEHMVSTSTAQMLREGFRTMIYSKMKMLAASALGLGLVVGVAAVAVSFARGRGAAIARTDDAAPAKGYGDADLAYQPFTQQSLVQKQSTSRSGDIGNKAGDPQKALGAADEKSDTLRAMLLEIRDKLRTLVEMERRLFNAGQARLGAVSKSNLQLLEVELKISRTREERRAVLERTIREAREIEEGGKHLHSIGQITAADVLEAEVARLGLQVRLEEEKRRGD